MNKFQTDSNPDKYDQNVLKNHQKVLKTITIEILKYFNVKVGKNFETGLQKHEADLSFKEQIYKDLGHASRVERCKVSSR